MLCCYNTLTFKPTEDEKTMINDSIVILSSIRESLDNCGCSRKASDIDDVINILSDVYNGKGIITK